MSHVGFTGTRGALTDAQRTALRFILTLLFNRKGSILHHGDCTGADEQAHFIAQEIGYSIAIHPPINKAYRAFLEASLGMMFEPKDYLDRNHDIVNLCPVLVAVPKGMQEETRSGTWATVRYARALKREICIIEPDGNKRWQKV